MSLSDLPLSEFQAADPKLDKSVYDVLGVEKAVAAMASYGSTNRNKSKSKSGDGQKVLG